ncbi:MAG: hypothetical protein HIU93_13945 [Acidobacteria bacterium]|nr:hypothetical protein [Acidobacteriota bacterium]MBW4046306.1 hypothetical protein [Acidobacteriota bacterium]
MRPVRMKRKGIALALLAGLASMAWFTVDPGRVRWLVMVLLGGFAVRVLLTGPPSRYDEEGQVK